MTAPTSGPQPIDWRKKLSAYPIDWAMWYGRRSRLRSRWVTDRTIAVRRSACDPRRIAKAETENLSSYLPTNVNGVGVEKTIGVLPASRTPAMWVGSWESKRRGIVALGDPEVATFFALRLRLLHLFCRFDAAFLYHGKGRRGDPHPLVVERDGEIVGLLMPTRVGVFGIEVPKSIVVAYRDMIA